MQELALKYFDNRCFITHRKFKPTGFVIHHLWYKKNDIERKNFPNTPKGRLEYMKKLKREIEKDPSRFVLITNGMHTRIDHIKRGLSRLRKDTLLRLFVVVLHTRKER